MLRTWVAGIDAGCAVSSMHPDRTLNLRDARCRRTWAMQQTTCNFHRAPDRNLPLATCGMPTVRGALTERSNFGMQLTMGSDTCACVLCANPRRVRPNLLQTILVNSQEMGHVTCQSFVAPETTMTAVSFCMDRARNMPHADRQITAGALLALVPAHARIPVVGASVCLHGHVPLCCK